MVLLEDMCNNTCLVLGLGSHGHHAHIPTAGEHDSPAIKSPVATMAAGYLSLTMSLAGAGGYSPESPVQSSPHGSATASNNSYSAAGNQKNVCPATNKLWRDAGGEVKWRSLQASDEEEGVGVRKKLKLTKEQSALLEESFKEHPTLNQMQKHALAKQLNLQARQVEVWFQNRKARTKLKQTEVDRVYLKRFYESLTHENRRLRRELQELKARKLFPQLYMPTITKCPSCGRYEAAVPTDGGITVSAGEAPAKTVFGVGPLTGYICGHSATHSSAAP